MKVKDLIEKLRECNPDSEVDIAYEQDNPLEGGSVVQVTEIRFHEDNMVDVVVLRG